MLDQLTLMLFTFKNITLHYKQYTIVIKHKKNIRTT